MLNLLSFRMSLTDVLEAEVTATRVQLVVARLDAAADDSVVVADVQEDLRDARPVYKKARTMPFSVKEHVDASLDKLIANGINEKVASSPWASPAVPVRQPNGSIRVCADYSKTINANSDLERYPLPTIEEIRTKLRGGKKFSTLDLSQAYHHLELADASKVYTTINTHRGRVTGIVIDCLS